MDVAPVQDPGQLARMAGDDLLHHADILPRVAREERFHRRHHRDVQRDPSAVQGDVGRAGSPGDAGHHAGLH